MSHSARHIRITSLNAMELEASAGQSLVRVETDAGIVGYGEAGASGPVTRANLAVMEPLLLGEDPLGVERLYARMTGGQHTYRAHIPTVSGVDIALWDLGEDRGAARLGTGNGQVQRQGSTLLYPESSGHDRSGQL